MDDSNKPLTQAEIDAMLSKGASAQPASAKAANAAPKPTPTATVTARTPEPPKTAQSAPVVNKETLNKAAAPPAATDESLRATITTLTQRIAKLEQDISRLDKALAEKKSAEGTQDLKPFAQKLQELGTQVEGISQGLAATPAYAARKNFKCNHCASQGDVATVLRCTKCGKDSWWGWWPKK